jgi:hypothetical protein
MSNSPAEVVSGFSRPKVRLAAELAEIAEEIRFRELGVLRG